jgi:hypothetical protein
LALAVEVGCGTHVIAPTFNFWLRPGIDHENLLAQFPHAKRVDQRCDRGRLRVTTRIFETRERLGLIADEVESPASASLWPLRLIGPLDDAAGSR